MNPSVTQPWNLASKDWKNRSIARAALAYGVGAKGLKASPLV